jgi:uncharacterized protein YqjF (DUF2071 family)
MLSWAVDPVLLEPRLPRGTELDLWEGRALASVVAFLFLRPRVWGVGVPLHRDFEEANLRFYVRRRGPEGWRRGVVFVQERVPRRAIAWTARALYGERYVASPMWHELEQHEDGWVRRVRYGWRRAGREESVALTAAGPPQELTEGSHEQFIAEHYWGYAALRDGGTMEYQVEHPSWRVAAAASSRLECDPAGVWGPEWGEALVGPPASAFLAEGSAVAVYRGRRLEP